MVRVQIGRGSNSTVDLTPEQENRARSIANTALENKSTIYFSRASFEGPEVVRQRAAFLYADARARSAITAYESYQNAKIAEATRNTIFVNEQGYSVAPKDRETFTKEAEASGGVITTPTPIYSTNTYGPRRVTGFNVPVTTTSNQNIIENIIKTSQQPARIEQRQTGTFIDKRGEDIPIFKTYVVGYGGNIIREATTTEYKQLKASQQNVLEYKEENTFNKIQNKLSSSKVLSKDVKGITQFKYKFATEPAGNIFVAPITKNLIPTSTGDVLITGTAIAASLAIPPSAPVIAGGFGILGGKAALNPSLPFEKRAAGGIVAVSGGAGLVAGGLPYARGLKARISPDFAPVKTQAEGFKAIEINEALKEVSITSSISAELTIIPKKFTRIGLILEGSPYKAGKTLNVDLPKTSPLVRGGFGVKSSEKKLFLGEQKVASAQISLLKQGKDLIFTREFFVSPEEINLGIAQIRVSRFGLTPFFSKFKNIKLGFGFPGKPQAVISEKVNVGFKETATTFRIGTTSELEAIKSQGKITDVNKIADTSIRGQGVEIFDVKFKPLGKEIKAPKLEDLTTEGTTTISTEGLFSTLSSGREKTFSIPKESLNVTPSKVLTTSKDTSVKLTLPSYSSLSISTSRNFYKTSPTIPKISPSLSGIKTTKLKISSPKSTTPTIKTPITIPKTTPYRTPGSPPFKPPKLPPARITPPRYSSNKRSKTTATTQAFRPFVVRKGREVFLPTKPLSRGQALRVGEAEARKSLRATFGIKEVKGFVIGKDINFTPSSKLFRSYRIRGGKKIPLKNTFIQRKGKRLISGGEISEIQKARRFKL